MQFEYQHKAGDETCTILFYELSSMKRFVIESFYRSFHYIGGKSQGTANYWKFPSFVSVNVIKEIIHNTCFVCGGLMQDGEATKNDDLYHENSGNTTVWPNTGKPKILQVRKCSSCGHSHT